MLIKEQLSFIQFLGHTLDILYYQLTLGVTIIIIRGLLEHVFHSTSSCVKVEKILRLVTRKYSRADNIWPHYVMQNSSES